MVYWDLGWWRARLQSVKRQSSFCAGNQLFSTLFLFCVKSQRRKLLVSCKFLSLPTLCIFSLWNKTKILPFRYFLLLLFFALRCVRIKELLPSWIPSGKDFSQKLSSEKLHHHLTQCCSLQCTLSVCLLTLSSQTFLMPVSLLAQSEWKIAFIQPIHYSALVPHLQKALISYSVCSLSIICITVSHQYLASLQLFRS